MSAASCGVCCCCGPACLSPGAYLSLIFSLRAFSLLALVCAAADARRLLPPAAPLLLLQGPPSGSSSSDASKSSSLLPSAPASRVLASRLGFFRC